MANGGRGTVAFDEQEATDEGINLGGVNDVDKQGEAHGHDKPHDMHEARTNPLLPKRRKVKSTRYAVLLHPLNLASTCNVDLCVACGERSYFKLFSIRYRECLGCMRWVRHESPLFYGHGLTLACARSVPALNTNAIA